MALSNALTNAYPPPPSPPLPHVTITYRVRGTVPGLLPPRRLSHSSECLRQLTILFWQTNKNISMAVNIYVTQLLVGEPPSRLKLYSSNLALPPCSAPTVNGLHERIRYFWSQCLLPAQPTKINTNRTPLWHLSGRCRLCIYPNKKRCQNHSGPYSNPESGMCRTNSSQGQVASPRMRGDSRPSRTFATNFVHPLRAVWASIVASCFLITQWLLPNQLVCRKQGSAWAVVVRNTTISACYVPACEFFKVELQTHEVEHEHELKNGGPEHRPQTVVDVVDKEHYHPSDEEQLSPRVVHPTVKGKRLQSTIDVTKSNGRDREKGRERWD